MDRLLYFHFILDSSGDCCHKCHEYVFSFPEMTHPFLFLEINKEIQNVMLSKIELIGPNNEFTWEIVPQAQVKVACFVIKK